MAQRSVSDTRNVVVVGHGSSGKTTLVDRLLHAAGLVNRPGSVDAGTSLSDYEPEEKQRKFSVESKIFNFQWEGKTFNVLDTPGYLDFAGAAAAAIPVVETALVTVHAADGVRLNTRRMWELAEKAGLTRILLVTHLDADNVHFDRLLTDIQENFGVGCVPLQLPIGLGEQCSGVVSLLEGEQAPPGVVGNFSSLRESLKESIIECDDSLVERYLEGEQIGAGEIQAVLRKAILAGKIVPILCAVAEKGLGVKEALSFLASHAPSPQEGPQRKATTESGEEALLEPRPDAPFCAQVFKSVVDVHVGRLVYFRVYSGSVSAGGSVQVARTGKSERLAHLYALFGAEQKEVPQAIPGDIVCVSKVEDVLINDTLRDAQGRWALAPIQFPRPMMSLAVEPHSRDDEQRISTGLQRLAESDPTLTLTRDQQSGELVITGMSNLHLDVMLSKLKTRYGVSADTHEPSIPYRETITRKAEASYRHKKQTGGRGQYGEVYLRLEPNERGAGFEFLDEIKGGVIPGQYIPAIEKGIVEAMQRGVLAGCPVVDLKAAVYYGSYHTVDSSEAAFKIASSRAFQAAFEQARPVLLEPIVKIEVTIPERFVGDVTGNLSGHRGRILGIGQVGRMQVLSAEIPMAEVRTYSAELQSMTGGEGTFTMEFSHYEVVPPHIQTQIVAQRKAEKEQQ